MTFEAFKPKKSKTTELRSSELYLLTNYSQKYLPNCLVGIRISTTFASAFRKEQQRKTLFEQITYRQVVRRACSYKSMSKGNTNRQYKNFKKGIETDLSKKRQTGASLRRCVPCARFFMGVLEIR